MEYLLVGNVVDSFGLDGTLKIFSITSMGEKRYQPGNKIDLVCREERHTLTVKSFRHNGKFDFVQFEEIANKESADIFKGFQVEIIKDQNDLEEGYYFYSDLRGCEVVDEAGKILGKVKEIEEFPAQLTLRVSRNGKPDFFVPFIKEFIIDVDINTKSIKINVIEGML